MAACAQRQQSCRSLVRLLLHTTQDPTTVKNVCVCVCVCVCEHAIAYDRKVKEQKKKRRSKQVWGSRRSRLCGGHDTPYSILYALRHQGIWHMRRFLTHHGWARAGASLVTRAYGIRGSFLGLLSSSGSFLSYLSSSLFLSLFLSYLSSFPISLPQALPEL